MCQLRGSQLSIIAGGFTDITETSAKHLPRSLVLPTLDKYIWWMIRSIGLGSAYNVLDNVFFLHTI